MKPNSRLFMLVLASAIVLAAGNSEAAEPVEMVRVLTAFQNRMALGDASARNAAAKQIEQIEQELPAVPPDAWKDPKNARAAAIYLLSGGRARTIRSLFEAEFFPESEKGLVSASLAYAEGRRRDAAKLLQPIDPRVAPPTLGGHLALVQGSILLGVNSRRASELFDLARLLMPGSLVEEGALRRQVSIVNDPDKLLLLGNRYVGRYSHSPFVENFWNGFSVATARMSLEVDGVFLAHLEGVFEDMPASGRFDTYLEIARIAISRGKAATALDHVVKAERLADTPATRRRLKLFGAVVDIISGNFERGLFELQKIDSKSLTRADSEMREIVMAAVKRLQESPETEKPEQTAEEANGAQIPLERSAREAVAQADELLRKVSSR